jgi:hypothetical protein
VLGRLFRRWQAGFALALARELVGSDMARHVELRRVAFDKESPGTEDLLNG